MKGLCLLVSAGGAAAVLVRGRRVAWDAFVPGELATIDETIGVVLAKRPSGLRRCRVALESDICPSKILRDLPPVSPGRLRRLIQFQSGRWFLLKAPIVTDASWQTRGVALVAGVHDPLVTAVVRAVEAAGLRVERVVPACHALAAGLADGVHRRQAGTIDEILTMERGRLVSVRRAFRESTAVSRESCVDTANAVVTSTCRLSLAPQFLVARRRARARRLWVGAAVAAVLVGMLAGASYLWGLEQAVKHADQRLAELQPAVTRVLAAEREGMRVADQAVVRDAARRSQGRDLALLERLTSALPDSAYLVELARDRAGRVRMVGRSRAPADVQAALRAGGLGQPRLAFQSGQSFTLDLFWGRGAGS